MGGGGGGGGRHGGIWFVAYLCWLCIENLGCLYANWLESPEMTG